MTQIFKTLQLFLPIASNTIFLTYFLNNNNNGSSNINDNNNNNKIIINNNNFDALIAFLRRDNWIVWVKNVTLMNGKRPGIKMRCH